MQDERDVLESIAKALLSKRALTHREIVAIEAFHGPGAWQPAKALSAALGRVRKPEYRASLTHTRRGS
jgi:hypothetical protein